MEAKRPKFYAVNALNESTAQVFLYGFIGDYDGANASDFVKDLMDLQNKYRTIEVHINSQGGSVYEGLAIITAIKQCKARLVGYIDGIAASMAAVIALSLPEVYMNRYARLMTHRVSAGCYGNADDMRTQADHIQSIENDLVDMIATKTGLSAAEVKEKYITNQDKWINAADALKEKLVTGIFDGPAVDVPENAKIVDVYNAFDQVINATKIEHSTIAII